jgi:CRP/FNR family transcriptional regulator, cyclic AMP receptor protein
VKGFAAKAKKKTGTVRRRTTAAKKAAENGRLRRATEPAPEAVLKENLDILKRIRLFYSLCDDELCTVWPKVVFREFKKSQTILQEQQANDFMYIVIQGKVKIFQVSEDGKERILSLHNAGEFFGEMALIDGATAPATVAALVPSLVAIISRDDFYSLLNTQAKILHNLLQLLCNRLRESWQKIQMLTFHNASDRVKMLLMMLADTQGEKTERGTVLTVKLIHQDIADMTGLTRETVTRVLDRFMKSGEITILSNKLIQLNPEFEAISL